MLDLLWEAVLAAIPLGANARAARLSVDPVLRSGSLITVADQQESAYKTASDEVIRRIHVSYVLRRVAVFQNRRQRTILEVPDGSDDKDRQVTNIEEGARQRWTRKSIDLLVRMNAPVVQQLEGRGDVHSLLGGVAGRIRGSTLRQIFAIRGDSHMVR